MIWLTSSTLARLRDQLQNRGARPSFAPAPDTSPEDALMMVISAEMGPLAEAMYLMMSADGEVSSDEREVLRGALRNLSDDTVRSAHIERLLDDAKARAEKEGREARLAAVAQDLSDDQARGEVAFVLAAAIAFADNAIADQENELLNSFAELLGLDEARANELLDAMESDLRQASDKAAEAAGGEGG